MANFSLSVNNIRAFDATKDYVVTFNFSFYCDKNRIYVYNTSTGTVVYDNVDADPCVMSHLIPAGTLSNGSSYYIVISGHYPYDDIWVNSSPTDVFKCIKTPTLKFANLSTTVSNSYLSLSVEYSQEQNEPINEYHIAVYTASGTVFWLSEALYDILAKTVVTGLSSDTDYLVRAYGTTLNGFVVDTGQISIHVTYNAPSLYFLASLENEKFEGYVKIKTRAASIEGFLLSGRTPVFEEASDNKGIDLESDHVIFNDGFVLNNDFIIEGAMHISPAGYGTFMVIEGNKTKIEVATRLIGASDSYKICLEVKDYINNYVSYSDAIDNSDTIYHFWVQRKNNLYTAKIGLSTIIM